MFVDLIRARLLNTELKLYSLHLAVHWFCQQPAFHSAIILIKINAFGEKNVCRSQQQEHKVKFAKWEELWQWGNGGLRGKYRSSACFMEKSFHEKAELSL